MQRNIGFDWFKQVSDWFVCFLKMTGITMDDLETAQSVFGLEFCFYYYTTSLDTEYLLVSFLFFSNGIRCKFERFIFSLMFPHKDHICPYKHVWVRINSRKDFIGIYRNENNVVSSISMLDFPINNFDGPQKEQLLINCIGS